VSNPYDTAKTSIIGPTLVFKGELRADEDLLIQGRVEGSIEHTSRLTIGEQGHVKADIKAQYINVEGQVEGDLFGSKSVMIKQSAQVKGNVYAPTVSLMEGATFNGSIDMEYKEQAARPVKPASRETAAKDSESGANRADDEKTAAAAG
jgi:cytoskeletal protein CcmA (bactofilin family)